MKAEGRHGLVFILPEAPDERRALGEALYELVVSGTREYRRLVVTCLPGVTFRPGNVVLLSPEGRVLASAVWSPDDARPDRFVQRFRELAGAWPDDAPPEDRQRLPFGAEPAHEEYCGSGLSPALQEDLPDDDEGLVTECGAVYVDKRGREFLTFLTEPRPRKKRL